MVDLSFLFSIGGIFKIIALVLIGLFSIFTLIIVNQIRNMDKTISLSATRIIRLFGYVLFVASLFLFILAVAIL